MSVDQSDYKSLFNALAQSVDGFNDISPEFLRCAFERFTHLYYGFSRHVQLAPEKRLLEAAQGASKLVRTGSLKFDIPYAELVPLKDDFNAYFAPQSRLTSDVDPFLETILEHSMEASELFRILYKDRLSESMLAWGAEIMKYHDLAEDIIGDFTPVDEIDLKGKRRIEALAIELLTENRKNGDILALHVYNAMQIFEGKMNDFSEARERMLKLLDSHGDHDFPDIRSLYVAKDIDVGLLQELGRDIDILHMSLSSTRIINDRHYRIPEVDARNKMEDFWIFIDEKIRTPEARSFFDTIWELYRTQKTEPASALINKALLTVQI